MAFCQKWEEIAASLPPPHSGVSFVLKGGGQSHFWGVWGLAPWEYFSKKEEKWCKRLFQWQVAFWQKSGGGDLPPPPPNWHHCPSNWCHWEGGPHQLTAVDLGLGLLSPFSFRFSSIFHWRGLSRQGYLRSMPPTSPCKNVSIIMLIYYFVVNNFKSYCLM